MFKLAVLDWMFFSLVLEKIKLHKRNNAFKVQSILFRITLWYTYSAQQFKDHWNFCSHSHIFCRKSNKSRKYGHFFTTAYVCKPLIYSLKLYTDRVNNMNPKYYIILKWPRFLRTSVTLNLSFFYKLFKNMRALFIRYLYTHLSKYRFTTIYSKSTFDFP